MRSITVSSNNTLNKTIEFENSLENGSKKSLPIISLLACSASFLAPTSQNLTVNKPQSNYTFRQESNSGGFFTFTNKNDTMSIQINEEGDVEMSNQVTQKDLKENERYLHEQINSLTNKFDTKIEGVSDKLNKIDLEIVKMQQSIENLPDKLKISKVDFFITKILLPILVPLIVAYFALKWGLK